MAKTKRHITDEDGLKAAMVETLRAVITNEGLTQVQAAEKLGITQAKVSGVLSGKAAISVEQLVRFITRLGYGTSITVKRTPTARPIARVDVAARG